MESKRFIGRPRGTTPAEDELLAAVARQSPSCTAMELLERLNLPVSRSTIYRRLTEAGINIRMTMGKQSSPVKKVFKDIKDVNGCSKSEYQSSTKDNIRRSNRLTSYVPILPKLTKTRTLEMLCKNIGMVIPDISEVIVVPFNHKKCAVCHCSHSQDRNPELYFFPFPKDPRRCALWAINCNRLDLFKNDIDFINKNLTLCEDHFDASQYYIYYMFSHTPLSKKHLVWNAVPTIFHVPSRPPRENYIEPSFEQYKQLNQEAHDDLQLVLLPQSPPDEGLEILPESSNGYLSDGLYNSDDDMPPLNPVCELHEINEQVNIPMNDNFDNSSTNSNRYKNMEYILNEDEFQPFSKKLRLSEGEVNCKNRFCLTEIIHSIFKQKNLLEVERCEIKSLSEKWNSLEGKKIEVENMFKLLEDDVAKLKNEFRNLQKKEIIDISDDEAQENQSLPEGIILSPLPESYFMQDKSLNINYRNNICQNSRSFNENNSHIIESSSEVIHLGQVAISRPNLPSIGRVERSDLVIGMQVIASKLSFLHSWCRAVILDALNGSQGEKLYRIRFDGKKNGGSLCTGKQLAYIDNPWVILPVGSRIVASYKNDFNELLYHAGIVAEPPKVMNNYRYLVFFDNGHAQYVKHAEIHLVCDASKEVWEDIHPDSKDFIKGYLLQYPERPMVKLQKGQIVNTEYNGAWLSAHVKEVDASLVKLEFENNHMEWIYRGSTRLAPLYIELATAQANRLTGKFRRHNLVAKRPHQPYVEYTRGIDEPIARPTGNLVNFRKQQKEQISNFQLSDIPSRPQVAKKQTGGCIPNQNIESSARIAKKSTTQERLLYNLMNEENRDDYDSNILQSQLGHREIHMISIGKRAKFQPHKCSVVCNGDKVNEPSKYRGKNPLQIPILCGWERQVTKHRAGCRRVVFYVTPCRRRLRSIKEVNHYLWKTKSKLTIDLFCFDSCVHTFSEFSPSRILAYIPDITYGKEDVSVSCVNSLYKEFPPYVLYSNVRFPAKGVQLNLDQEFLCGCDCEDNCQDRDRCQCQQLTINATEALPSGRIPDAGYKFRRLKEPLITGIYECNSKCKCGPSCMNRVAQNGLQVRLQLFRTERKGWGIRCLDDIPQGMFICIYAGQLLTEQGANEDGHQYGDEYLAELDHIEVVERLKEGYESDVVDPEENDKEDSDDSTEDSDESSYFDPSQKDKADSDSDFDVDFKEVVEYGCHSTRSRKKLLDVNNLSEESSINGSKANSLEKIAESCTETQISTSEKFSSTFSINDENVSLLTADEIKVEVETDTNNADLKIVESCSDLPKTEITPILGTNLPEVKKVTVPWVPQLAEEHDKVSDIVNNNNNNDDNKNNNNNNNNNNNTSSEGKIEDESMASTSLFSNLPDPKKGPLLNTKTELRNENSQFVSVRKFFNEEYCYIMDAKNCGNIGRYLNPILDSPRPTIRQPSDEGWALYIWD
ncbi:histone-lysine N-methyltransferase SETDB1-like [Centruroides sculpturatus]|uniref:histone-lysine N-methyltransferase SETDB1-like n=1 Tax=Centruroides sculpturatus TaxID=218467 RepID=UPI000C6DB8EB|nr:histone-lysine N-methyltransferase SETDB1-like [Centruroides sculpturatus]